MAGGEGKAGEVGRSHVKGFQFYCRHNMMTLCLGIITLEVQDRFGGCRWVGLGRSGQVISDISESKWPILWNEWVRQVSEPEV